MEVIGSVVQKVNGYPSMLVGMIHQFDHRAASVKVNPESLHNPALSGDVGLAQKADPDFVPAPQYWVPASEVRIPNNLEWTLVFRNIARATDARTMIITVVPFVGLGNSVPILTAEDRNTYCQFASCFVANFNALLLDYIVRQKMHGTNLNWYIVEQLPVIPLDHYETIYLGPKTAGEIIRKAVLELTYTAHDMAPFARDMGYVDENGKIKPPFVWNEERRLHLRAKLDAVFFHLYGIVDRNDVRYIFSTFPIVEDQEIHTNGNISILRTLSCLHECLSVWRFRRRDNFVKFLRHRLKESAKTRFAEKFQALTFFATSGMQHISGFPIGFPIPILLKI